MNTPSNHSDSSLVHPQDLEKSKKLWLRAVWASALLMVLPVFAGLAGTVYAMIVAFGKLAPTDRAAPDSLAGAVSLALRMTMWGLGISLVVSIAFIVSLVMYTSKRSALSEVESRNESRKPEVFMG